MTYLVSKLKQKLPNNRQTYFNDISIAPRIFRRPKSKIIQFYSSYRNIGNYTAVQGIHHLLGYELDTWDIHETPVDWEYINKNYSSVIIGGAGLLHGCFTPFWKDFLPRCRLPYVIWGIGLCLPENEEGRGVPVEIVKPIFEGALCANVRDELTRDFYSLENVDISICPTVAMIRQQMRDNKFSSKKTHAVLHSIHTTLTEDSGNNELNDTINQYVDSLVCTDNLQSRKVSIDDVLALYPSAGLVICTRLHGAIIAFAFNIPYIAFSFDPKVSAFVELYGGGVLCKSVEQLAKLLADESLPEYFVDNGAEANSLAFGKLAKSKLEAS